MRAPIVFPIRVAAGPTIVQTTTREVSADGVFVCPLRPPKPGTQVSLKLYLPGGPQAEEATAVVGEWRSAPEGGYWAEFIDPPQTLRDRIAGLLERRARAAASGPPTPIGAMSVAQKPLELHAVVTVTLELPDGGNPVEAKGVVVHRVSAQDAKGRNTPSGAGVQF